MAAEPLMDIEVIYALPAEQHLVRLRVAAGTTVMQALQASGVLERYPEIDRIRLKLGVFGKVVRPERRLNPGDRVEIYRPLSADPKEVRRRRALLRPKR